MKGQKLFSLDMELIEELKKEANSSKIVNELLKDYLNKNDTLKKQELIKKYDLLVLEIKTKQDEMIVLAKQIEKIEADETRTNEIYKNIPKEIIDDIAFFNKMDINILLVRYKQLYSKKFNGLTWEELKKAFNCMRGNE